jgi:type II secretory pathway predicted ATPase ExeA/DNA-binding phage protein
VLGGSKKYCLLTDEAHQALRSAIASEREAEAGNFSEIARLAGLDTDSVTKILDRKTASYSTLKKMMEGFGLELTESSYTKADPPKLTKPTSSFPPNPFEQTGLWGCDELLRRIFERLGKGGSQALIGPVGCGKSEILRAIVREESGLKRPVLSLNMDLVRDERSFFVRLCHCFELEAGSELSLMPMQIERELKRRKQAHVLCLDEIHVLTDEAFFPLATRNWLKGMADAAYPLQLVVTSQKDLRELFPDSSVRSSPLADFFSSQTERLDYWGLQQVTDFVAEHLRGTEVMFTSEQMADLHEQGGGRPREVRSAAAKLYDRMVAGVDQV